MPTVLLETDSPHGNAQAIVEADAQAVQFYLYFPECEGPHKVKSCWVRNLGPAPAELDVASMRSGAAPMLPAAHCKHPRGDRLPAVDSLSIVWFEEGNGAALLEGEEVLAVIPPWSGMEGFHGYARDCSGETPLCWPLPDGGPLTDRIERAKAYWQLWSDDSLWPRYRDEQIAAYETAFQAAHVKYYAIDGGNWPPKALLRFDLNDCRVLVTCGVSLRAQPNVEFHVEDAAPLRRIELGAALGRECPEAELMPLARYLSAQSGYPWSCGSWLGHGHTMPCDCTPPSLGGENSPAVLFVAETDSRFAVRLPRFRGDPVNLLWAIPISGAEREMAERQGSTVLLQRLRSATPLLPVR